MGKNLKSKSFGSTYAHSGAAAYRYNAMRYIALSSAHDYEILNTVANRIIEITPDGYVDRTCTYEEFLEYKKNQNS